MTIPRHPLMRVIAAVLALLPLPAAAQGRGPGLVVLRLRDRAVVTARTVTLADVAELTGGLAVLRERIGLLDVAEVPRDGGGLSVSRRQVEYRLRLAEVPSALYRVEGAGVTQIGTRFRPVTSDEVVAAARKTLLGRLPWSADEVQIDLIQPVVAPLPAVAADEQLTIKAEPHPGQRPPGRLQVDVRLFVQGEQRFALPVYFNVRPCQRVVVCRHRINRGEELTAASVFVERQPVDGRGRNALSPEAMARKRARHTLLPGHMVLLTDVEDQAAPPQHPVVKPQDAVRLLVKVGGLKVTAAGQALQEGRVGQLIRVQNVDSKKVILGRVVEAGLVEVE
jgi:flagella basal body P-ring formation protein FlgA